MTYNKSEIMKNAWNNFKTGKCVTFSEALKLAWATAKNKPETIEAAELNTGDTITIEYGDYGNNITCVITNISKELFMNKYYIFNAASKNNSNIEFCLEAKETVTRTAIAA